MAEDILSAKRAGVIPVAVYREQAAYHTRSYLEEEHPAFIIDDLNELAKIVVGDVLKIITNLVFTKDNMQH